MKKKSTLLTLGVFIVLTVMFSLSLPIENSSAATSVFLRERNFSATTDYSSEIEKRIRSGVTSTADLIVDYHPRVWMMGNWDWDKDNVGSFAWRIVHGGPMGASDPANDGEKYEFSYVFSMGDETAFGEIENGTYGTRYLWTLVAAEARARHSEWNLPADLPSTSKNPDYDPKHTEDELLADARDKLLYWSDPSKIRYEWPYRMVIDGSVAYDWLVDRKFSDGVTPVLSEAQRTHIQNGLIGNAEYVRSNAGGSGQLFESSDIANYIYVMVGIALYEPSGQNISTENNAKVKQYLDEFDEYWIGKILPALNEQGGTGGWHAGLCNTSADLDYMSDNQVITYHIAPILFAHYTATGQSYEDSVFSTGALKYAIEFQNHMVYPDGEYLAIGEQGGLRYRWIMPMQPTARRRFSSDPEQQALGELAGWFRNEIAPETYVNAGSHDTFKQLTWEQKFANGRSPQEIGFGGTRYFAKLGWVAMRSGFTSPDDLAALFISQRYHWSDLNPYAQNSFTLERKGQLIEGYQNAIRIDGEYQRAISEFPTIADGVEAYARGSIYDVGPGILAFESNDIYDYMLGDATNAYDVSKLSQFTRQLVYLKPDIFIIFDKVVTTDPDLEKKWVVDPAATPQDQGNNLLMVDNGSGALWIKRLLPTSANVALSGSEISVVSSEASIETYFLHVMQAADSGLSAGQVAADDATVIQEGNWFHVQVGGHQVSFSKDGDFEFDGQSAGIQEDLNQDGVVNEADVQICIQVILGFESDPIIVDRADVNGDGRVNAVDLQRVVNAINR